MSLKVLEAYTRDVGRGVARVDYDGMAALDASTGDIVEILGKSRTVAKCLPLYPSDQGRGLIRMDGLIRLNSGIAIGDTVTIRKIKALPAEKVVVTPQEVAPPIEERYVADALESVPVSKGDKIMVPYFGGRVTFQVIDVSPNADAVLITPSTTFRIESRERMGLSSPEDIEALSYSIVLDSQEYHPTENSVHLKWLVGFTRPGLNGAVVTLVAQLKIPVNKETLSELSDVMDSSASEEIGEIKKHLLELRQANPDTRLEINLNDAVKKIASKVYVVMQEKGLNVQIVT